MQGESYASPLCSGCAALSNPLPSSFANKLCQPESIIRLTGYQGLWFANPIDGAPSWVERDKETLCGALTKKQTDFVRGHKVMKNLILCCVAVLNALSPCAH